MKAEISRVSREKRRVRAEEQSHVGPSPTRRWLSSESRKYRNEWRLCQELKLLVPSLRCYQFRSDTDELFHRHRDDSSPGQFGSVGRLGRESLPARRQ